MPFTTTETNNILNWALGKSNGLTSKIKVYIGLLKNDPEADNGTCQELSGDTYHRVLISAYNNTDIKLIGSADARVIQNTAQIAWTKATATWPEVKGIALYTTESGTTAPFYYAKVPTPFTVNPRRSCSV